MISDVIDRSRLHRCQAAQSSGDVIERAREDGGSECKTNRAEKVNIFNKQRFCG